MKAHSTTTRRRHFLQTPHINLCHRHALPLTCRKRDGGTFARIAVFNGLCSMLVVWPKVYELKPKYTTTRPRGSRNEQSCMLFHAKREKSQVQRVSCTLMTFVSIIFAHYSMESSRWIKGSIQHFHHAQTWLSGDEEWNPFPEYKIRGTRWPEIVFPLYCHAWVPNL